ncbi:LamG-like jellyroll fold domain-containing protein [Phytomonospora endophytica]|uniref:RHS repeat-associated protein n=1 Tax=Phytomonospora endophytica TaxID=714109 RepID=A0A841FPK8_9ACTN|nr:LamG-like jellyroll fold domain-containing protein [Phytomonospora endophytica]MBB6038036.1 RHS repeat-associated protein [Phytomonospora endophytica]
MPGAVGDEPAYEDVALEHPDAIEQQVGVLPGLEGDEPDGFVAGKSVELVQKRTATTTVFANPDGTQTLRTFSQPVFKEVGGGFAKIDTSLRLVGDRWTPTNASVVSFGVDTTDPTLVHVNLTPTTAVAYSLAGAAVVSGTAVGPSITYDAVMPETTLRLTATAGGTKEELVLASGDAASSWLFPLRTDGVAASIDAASGAVVFSDVSGAVVGSMPRGFAVDSRIDRDTGEGARTDDVTYEIVEHQGGQAIRMTLDRGWLTDPNRVFPVTVDPDVEVRTSSDTYVMKPYTNNYSGESELKVGAVDGQIAAGLLAFSSLKTDLKNKFIRGAKLQLFNSYSYSCSPRKVTIYRMTKAWTSNSSMSWPGPAYDASTPVASKSFAHGYSGCTAAWESFSIDRMRMTKWVHGTEAFYGLRIGASSSDKYGWKRFTSANFSGGAPYLDVTYSDQGATYLIPSGKFSPSVTAASDGKIVVRVTNWGTTTWKKGTGYALRHEVLKSDGTTLVRTEAAKFYPTSDVAPHSSIDITMTVKLLPIGSYVLRMSMQDPNGTWFNKAPYEVPSGVAAFNVANSAPYVAGNSPAHGATSDSIRPTLWLDYADPDNAPVGKQLYAFKACTDQAATNCIESGYVSTSSWVVPAGLLKWNQPAYWWGRVNDSVTASAVVGPMVFTPQPEQPAVTSHLAGAADGGDVPGVNPQVGNYTTTVTDASVNVSGPALSVTRTYNSQDLRITGAFGAGWSTWLDQRLAVDGDGSETILATLASGTQIRFGRNPDGTYASPAGNTLQLVKTGSAYVLRDSTGSVRTFSFAGELISISDASGRLQELTHVDGHVTRVTDKASGRSLHLTWTNGHITAVATDSPAAGEVAATWTYAYDGDRLITACSPLSAASCTTYGYADSSYYQSVVKDSNPHIYYPLDETEGSTLANATPQDEDADDGVSTGLTLGVPGAITGAAGTAVGFAGGIDSSIVLPNEAVDGAVQTGFELWFKAAPGQTGILLNQQNTAISAGDPTEWSPLLYIGTDGLLRSGYWMATSLTGPGKRQQLATTARVDDGAWHHVVLTSAVTQQAFYLDGTLAATESGRTIDHTTRSTFLLGTGYTGGSWPAVPTTAGYFGFAGQIDDVAIYKHALSATQVATHHAVGRLAGTRLNTITEPGGFNAATAIHDSTTGRLLTFSDRNSATWTLGGSTVAEKKRQVTITPSFAEPITYTYDIEHGGRLVSRQDGIGTKSYEYNEAGFVSKIVDEVGQSTAATTDARGNKLSVTTCRTTGSCQTKYFGYFLNEANPLDPRNDQTVWASDGRSASATDTVYRTTYTLDTAGRVTVTTYPKHASSAAAGSESTEYTTGTETATGGGNVPPGLPKKSTSLLGAVTTYAYFPTGDLAETVEPGGLVTQRLYDKLGRVRSTSQGSGTGSAFIAEGTTATTYNPIGQVATSTAPAVENPITEVTHTPLTTNNYDDAGRLLQTTISDTTGGDTSRTWNFAYDPAGRPTSTIGPDGTTTISEWDAAGDKIAETTATGLRLEYTFDDRHRRVRTTAEGTDADPAGLVDPADPEDSGTNRLITEARTYYDNDLLAGVVNANGEEITYDYYSDGLTKATYLELRDSDHEMIQRIQLSAFTYDAAGKATKAATTTGTGVHSYTYNARGFVTTDRFYDDPSDDPASCTEGWCPPATTTGVGEEIDFSYDAAGNSLLEEHYEIRAERLIGYWSYDVERAFDPAGRMTSETKVRESSAPEWLGVATARSVITTAEETTTYTHTARGEVATATNPAGVTERYTYDAFGRLTASTAGARTVWENGTEHTGVEPTTIRGYNTFGEPTHERNVDGGLTTTAYDAMGRPLTTSLPTYTTPGPSNSITPVVSTEYGPHGQPVTETDPRGNVTAYTYDLYGRVTTQTDPDPDGNGPKLAGLWTSTYDRLGRVLSRTDPSGAVTQATWDALGNQLTNTTTERVDGQLAYFTTHMTYDHAGNLTSTKTPSGQTTNYTYYANGLPDRIIEANGDYTRHEYPADLASKVTKTTVVRGDSTYRSDYQRLDGLGNAIVVNEGGNSYGQRFDDDGRLIEVEGFYTSHGTANSPTRYTYNNVGQVATITTFQTLDSDPVASDNQYADPVTVQLGYDRAGRLTHMVDGNGNSTDYTFNAMGLQESTIEPATAAHPNPADRTWTTVYDAAGNATVQLMPAGVKRDITYDALNRITNETGTGAESATAAKTFDYDALNRTTSVSGPNGATSLSYNDRGLLTTVAGANTATYNHDGDGRIASRTDAAGTSTFTYDNVGNLKTLTDPITSTTHTYTWRPDHQIAAIDYGGPERTFTYEPLNGRLASDTFTNPAGEVTASTTYGYDVASRLTSKTTTGLTGAGTNTYGYDGLGRLTRWTAPDQTTTTYGWDNASNRTTVTTPDGTRTSTYNERNQLINASGGSQPDETWTYTPRGTLRDHTLGTDTTTNNYDAYERLTSVTTTAETVSYGYDALDRLTTRNGATGFTYNDLTNNPVITPDSIVLRDPTGDIVSRNRTAGAALTWTDQHDDVIADINAANGAITASNAYSPFGETAADRPINGLGYQGGYTDPATKQVNAHARWYDPTTGAFKGRDTWQLTPSPTATNRYGYAAGSPLNYTDPNGHDIFGGRFNTYGRATSGGGTRASAGPSPIPRPTEVVGWTAVGAALIAAMILLIQLIEKLTATTAGSSTTTSTGTGISNYPAGHICVHNPRACDRPDKPPTDDPRIPRPPNDDGWEDLLDFLGSLADRPDDASKDAVTGDDQIDLLNGLLLDNDQLRDKLIEQGIITVDDSGNVTSINWDTDGDCSSMPWQGEMEKARPDAYNRTERATWSAAYLCGDPNPHTKRSKLPNPWDWPKPNGLADDGTWAYDRCHLLGRQLSGPDTRSNLVTCFGSTTNRGDMLTFENETYQRVNPRVGSGEHIIYIAVPLYGGTEIRIQNGNSVTYDDTLSMIAIYTIGSSGRIDKNIFANR